MEVHHSAPRRGGARLARCRPVRAGPYNPVGDHIELAVRIGERGDPGLGPPVVELNVAFGGEAVAAVKVETVLGGRVRRLGGEDVRHGRRAPAPAGGPRREPSRPSRSGAGRRPWPRERRPTDGRRPGRSRSGSPNASRCTGVGSTDLDRLARQSDQCRGAQDPHLIEGGGERIGWPDLPPPEPRPRLHRSSGRVAGAHVGDGAYLGRPLHGDEPIAMEREHNVGDGAVGEELAFHGAGDGSPRETMRVPPSASSSRLPRIVGGQQASGRRRLGEGDGGDPATGLFGNQRKLEDATAPTSDVLGDADAQAHPCRSGGPRGRGRTPRGSAARTLAGSASLPKRPEKVCRTNCCSSVSARFT